MNTNENKQITNNQTKNNTSTKYEKPTVEILGRMEELTGSTQQSNADGAGYRGCI